MFDCNNGIMRWKVKGMYLLMSENRQAGEGADKRSLFTRSGAEV